MTYLIVYAANLIFSVLVMAGMWVLSVNEVDPERRKRVVFFALCCVIEVVILVLYIPKFLHDSTTEDMLSLLLAKFILKPAWLRLVLYDWREQRRKIRRSRKFGQVASLLPQDAETVDANREASVLGKAKEAADEAQRLLNDSAIREAKPS